MGLIEGDKIIEISDDFKRSHSRPRPEIQNPVVKMAVFVLNLPWTLCGLLLGLVSLPFSIKMEEDGSLIVMKVKRIWFNEIFMRRWVIGATSGAVILLSGRAEEFTYDHELIHVRQFEAAPFYFPLLYFAEVIRHGYSKNRYEQEAYWLSGNGHGK